MFQQETRLDVVPLLTMPDHAQIPSTKANKRANFHLSWLWGGFFQIHKDERYKHH